MLECLILMLLKRTSPIGKIHLEVIGFKVHVVSNLQFSLYCAHRSSWSLPKILYLLIRYFGLLCLLYVPAQLMLLQAF